MMFAQVSGLKAGELVHVISDAHIYDRHIDIIKELIRSPLPLGILSIVFLPITTVLPVVFSLKYARSPDIWASKSPSLPIDI